jgi:predicted ATP-grasp superfamily ATP-dependent carboligase
MTGRDRYLIEDNSAPVVVLGCFHHGGLCAVRSLGRLGVPAYAVDADKENWAFFSKYCRGKFLWNLHAAPFEESVGFLREVGRRLGRRSVLIPTSDTGAIFVADHADQLSDRFIFPRPGAGLIRSLCSKKEMYHLARKCGVPTPETAFPQSRDDVLKYAEVARFPILLKPILSQRPGRAEQTMAIVETMQALLERYDAVEDPLLPNLMLQEYIPGRDDATWVFNGYFDTQGECRVSFTGRKLRNHPPYFGNCSLGICQQNDEVEQITIRFMRAIGYKGAVDLGYRYDARDGRYKIHDVNPRVGAMFRVFVGENGVDVTRALYQDMTGQAVVPARALEGRKWIVEDGDLASTWRYYRDGNLSFNQWRTSLRGIDEGTFIDRDDPWPGIYKFTRRERKAWRRALRRASTRVAAIRSLADRIKRRLGISPSFGDLGKTTPFSTNFGHDRGTPIDRYYIESFLAAHAHDIKGRTLELRDDAYTARFGGTRTTRRDVLHLHAQNPAATIVGDLSQKGTLEPGIYDCLVVTQTLQYIYNIQAAIEELYSGLRKDGILLLTSPGISPVMCGEQGENWFWSLTASSARRLFEDAFGSANVEVQTYGNVFAATAFLQGLALEEVPKFKLDPVDETYPVIIGLKAKK